MKTFLSSCVLSVGLVGNIMAACPEPDDANYATIASLNLPGKMVCAQRGSDRWQEQHNGTASVGGTVVDFKKGPSDPVDPSKLVGSWRVDRTDPKVIVYDYGTGGVYSYRARTTSGVLSSLCPVNLPGPEIPATLKLSGSSCP